MLIYRYCCSLSPYMNTNKCVYILHVSMRTMYTTRFGCMLACVSVPIGVFYHRWRPSSEKRKRWNRGEILKCILYYDEMFGCICYYSPCECIRVYVRNVVTIAKVDTQSLYYQWYSVHCVYSVWSLLALSKEILAYETWASDRQRE